MVTIVAPALRASTIRLHRWLFVSTVFDPQFRISLHPDSRPIGSAPCRPRPTVYSNPRDVPADAQIVRSSLDAPSRWKNRRSRLLDWSFPIVPQ